MQCPQCIQPYHQEKNIPRILIGCGHTLCEKCISCFANKSQTNYMKQVIECPECGTINEADSVQSFPKNLAAQHGSNDYCGSNLEQIAGKYKLKFTEQIEQETNYIINQGYYQNFYITQKRGTSMQLTQQKT